MTASAHQSTEKSAMRLRIIGTNPPGLACGCHSNVHVALQERADPVQIATATGSTIVFTAELTVIRNGDERDFRGPCVQGRRGDRFVYLTWGEPNDAGFNMFRRAKLMLDAIGPEILREARSAGALEARLCLSDDSGMPRCAAVRPPDITWVAGDFDN